MTDRGRFFQGSQDVDYAGPPDAERQGQKTCPPATLQASPPSDLRNLDHAQSNGPAVSSLQDKAITPLAEF
jgi:hypothetical protein